MLEHDLIKANEDLFTVSLLAKNMGWGAVSEQTFHRVIYLAQVLYSFKHKDINIFNHYHFTVAPFGPFSNLIMRGLAYLKGYFFLVIDEDGGLAINPHVTRPNFSIPDREVWLKTIMLMLGKYGEKQVFGFIINDPSYENALLTNNMGGVDTTSNDSVTLKVLNDFKCAFEQTLDESIIISDEKYIELYFDYVFGQMIIGN